MAAFKALAVLALIVVAIVVVIYNHGVHERQVERALAEQGYLNADARNDIWVVCMGGGKGRYGFKWTATRNGQRVQGEACSGGLFMKTVIKP